MIHDLLCIYMMHSHPDVQPAQIYLLYCLQQLARNLHSGTSDQNTDMTYWQRDNDFLQILLPQSILHQNDKIGIHK